MLIEWIYEVKSKYPDEFNKIGWYDLRKAVERLEIGR